MRSLLLFLIIFLNLDNLLAQTDTLSITGKVFSLGEVTITESRPDAAISVVRKDEIESRNQVNIAEVLGEIPGITLSNAGQRNENTVFIRGYDTRQISLLVDGIPVYIPYDGNIDLGRFLSFNYEKVVVTKGYSSMLYGPNTMGGAINLVTAEPTEKFEIRANADIDFGNEGYNGNSQNLQIGGRSGKYFYQGTFTRNDLNNWDLSDNYEPGALQTSGERMNSYEKDHGMSFRLGYSLKKDHKYVLSFSMQNGEKGVPVYDGQFSKRFWKMPEWDKRSLYLNSTSRITTKLDLITRWYFDTFTNTLESFDDETFSTQTRNYAFTSYYDDYSLGNSIQLVSRLFQKNETNLSFQFKNDLHNESSAKEQDPLTEIIDNSISFGAENHYVPNEKIRLVGGISYNIKANQKALQYYTDGSHEDVLLPSGTDQALNYMVGITYAPFVRHTFWLNTSENSRFATMKERYSYRLGRSVPNPDLGSERSKHVNLGYKGSFGKMDLTTELFLNKDRDKIAYVSVNPDTLQYQNIEKSTSYGIDLKFGYQYAGFGKIRIDYSYLKIQNPDDPDFYFILIPEHNLGLLNEFRFAKRLTFLASYRFISERNSYTDGSYPVKEYGLVNTDLTVKLAKFVDLRASVHNLFDVNYFYSEGYPARGRNFSFGLMLDL